MLIKSKIEIKPYQSKFIVSQDDRDYFIVNKNSIDIINTLKTNSDIESAYHDYRQCEGEPLSFNQYKDVAELISNTLSRERNTLTNQYLPLRYQLFKPNTIGKIAQKFVFLYKTSKQFWLIFITALIFNSINLFFISGSLSIHDAIGATRMHLGNGLLYLLLLALTPFVHEIGHLSGCRYFNAKHGGIGIGFYFIFPVFYADISGIWMISPKDRIKVNLGGIYFELIYTTLIIIASFVIKDPVLRVLSGIILTLVLQQLNPFLRYDGYWILSDLMNIHNLKQNSRQIIKLFITNLFKFRMLRIDLKIFLLIFYGIINYIFLGYLLFILFIKNTREILLFPITIVELAIKFYSGSGNLDLRLIDFGNYLLYSLFYLLLINFIYNFLKVRCLKREKISNSKKIP